MTKLKVVWICHFTNDEIQDLLSLWKRKEEFASWIPNVLKGFENRDDIELYVISPHEYLKRSTSFQDENVHYYFIPYGIPIIHRHWPGRFRYDVYNNFSSFRKKVRKIVDKIKPDLINLIGTENAYYSSSILDFKDEYSILITIQGLISQMKGVGVDSLIKNKRTEVEEEIISEFKYFAGEQDSSTYIKTYNPEHRFFKLYFPVNEEFALSTLEKEKKYDCIYYGRVNKIKGTEEFIKVIAELKRTIPKIKACIVGQGKVESFKNYAYKLDCLESIDFLGFMKTQKELFEKVKSSKVFLTPPFFERLSSTIREAMYLKIPIVAYATGGIPYINEFDEYILMVETGDYKAMAEKTLYLLQNEKERIALSEKAYQYALEEFSLKSNTERLINAYKTIIGESK